MSITDPLADMFTVIRNANRAGKERVEFPSSKLKLEILDERPDKRIVGITADIYRQPILIDRSGLFIMEEAFRMALSEANWIISDDAEVTYQVKVVEIRLVWAAQFSSNHNARVAMDVSVLRDSRVLGRKRIVDTGWYPNKLSAVTSFCSP